MSDYLRISKNGNLYLDNQLITTDGVDDINNHLIGLLGFYASIDQGVTMEELMHSVFGLKKFIAGYFTEEYEVMRAFTASSKLDKKYKCIKFYKSFKIETEEFLDEDEFLYILPEIVFVECAPGEQGYTNLGELPVIIENNMILTHNDIEIKVKNKFTFMDILSCIFDEMSHVLKSGEIVTV